MLENYCCLKKMEVFNLTFRIFGLRKKFMETLQVVADLFLSRLGSTESRILSWFQQFLNSVQDFDNEYWWNATRFLFGYTKDPNKEIYYIDCQMREWKNYTIFLFKFCSWYLFGYCCFTKIYSVFDCYITKTYSKGFKKKWTAPNAEESSHLREDVGVNPSRFTV